MNKIIIFLLFISSLPITLFSRTNTSPALKTVIVFGQKQELSRSLFPLRDFSENTGNTLPEKLKTAPGVIMTLNGSRNEPVICMGGYGIKHIPLLIDGIPVYVPYDGYPDLGRFSTLSFRSIEIIRGLVPVTSGPNCFAGVINLVTRMPEKKIEVETGCGTTLDRKFKKSGLEGWLRTGFLLDRWSAQLSVSKNVTDFFTLPESFTPTANEDGGRRDNSSSDDSTATLNLQFKPSVDSVLRLHYVRERGSKDIPVYTGSDSSIKRRYWRVPQWDKDSVFLLGAIRLSFKKSLDFKIWYDRFNNTFESYDDDTYSSMTNGYTFRSIYNDYTMGAAAQFSSPLLGGDLFSLSLRYKFDCHREHSDSDPETVTKDSTLHIAAEDVIPLSKKLSLTLGTAWSAMIPSAAEEYVSSTSGISNFSLENCSGFDFQGKITWKTGEKTSLLFGIEQRTRIPSMKDRYSYKMGKALPNPGLATEKNNSVTAAFAWKILPDLTITPEVFVNKAHDFITAITVSPGVTQNRNSGEILFYGGSLQITGSLINKIIRLNLSYSYIRWHQYDISPEITDLSHHKLAGSIRIQPLKRVSLTADFYSVSDSESATDGSRPVDGHCSADLSLQVIPFHTITLTTGIRNITDRLYETMEGYPMAGRTYFFRLSWKY